MHEPGKPDFDELLCHARAGDPEVRQDLLERFRNYLTLLASVRLDRNLQAKFDQSDLVQETMIQANHNFSNFRGTSEPELAGWLNILPASILTTRLPPFTTTIWSCCAN
jgi:RNA polymerase sigma-70 factor (ECF subfamily)